MFWADYYQWNLVFNVPICFTISPPVFVYTLRAVSWNALGCEFANTGDYNGLSTAELFQRSGFFSKLENRE